MNNYWVSWYQPTDDYRPLKDPPKVEAWWCSGHRCSDEAATICAWVKAKNEKAAKKVILEDWPEAEEWRFVDKKPDDWEPYSDRFPRKAKK